MKGLGVSEGIGIGRAFVIGKKEITVVKRSVDDVSKETERFTDALKVCQEQIEDIYQKTLRDIGEKEAGIFRAHGMILEDEVFISEVKTIIRTEKVNAEYALDSTTANYVRMFEEVDDEYLRERVNDIKDVMSRILKILMGLKISDYSDMAHDTVIVASDLTPSDTAQIDKKRVAAIITERGCMASHVAIIARTMGIPTVVNFEGANEKIKDGDTVICDGSTGRVVINPGCKQRTYYQSKKNSEEKLKHELQRQIGQPTVTLDGVRVELTANMGILSDVDAVMANDAEGVGLFRSEFVYMNRDCLPCENEQFEVYKNVLSRMEGKPVIIRTLDIGGDKEVPYLSLPKEMNPFLGYRAIRLCLDNKSIFKAQLRAILRASVYGNVKIMFPMISTMKELRDAKSIYEDARAELRAEGVPFRDDIEVGIMIEIPSAAIISDLLAKEVDFFSIGTNDLIQYTMAVDRLNSKLTHLYSQYHPALLRLVRNVIKNGHNEGKWVGMCGEAAGDPNLIPVFLGMGLDEFSMSPPAILRARHIIRGLSKHDMKSVAEHVVNLDTAMEVENYLNSRFSSDEHESYLSSMCRSEACSFGSKKTV